MMGNEKLFIAPRINVGFQERSDTYTGKLAYVIYYDLKGVLRKEKSWESWRDHKIEAVEFDNVPTEGFVLNKKVGGGRSDWNVRQEYVRVYDPRNFEFEITVPNLLFILRECDCSRGKGLEGKFVYAWSGATLVLLPVSAEEYKKSAEFTSIQARNIPAKELVKGAAYLTKKQEKLIYLDRRVRYNRNLTDWATNIHHHELMYVFWDEGKKGFSFHKDTKKLAAEISSVPASNYAELVSEYDKSIHGSPPVRLFTKKQPARKHDTVRYWDHHTWAKECPDGIFRQYRNSYMSNGDIDYIQETYEMSLGDHHSPAGKGTKSALVKSSYTNYYSSQNRRYGITTPPPTVLDQGLWVELSSGAKFKFNGSQVLLKGDTDGED